MTIREYILNGAIASAEERLEKLIEMGSPDIMLESIRNNIDNMKAGELKIGGDTELLDEEFVDREFKTGKGGKHYIQINGNINFFPNAKYGMYIKKGDN